jgi:hypothetical protein
MLLDIILHIYCSCWISAENPKTGAIWAFAVPMLVVILVIKLATHSHVEDMDFPCGGDSLFNLLLMQVNLFFLLAALRSLYRVSKSKLDKDKMYGKKDLKMPQALFKYVTFTPVIKESCELQ